MPWYKSGTVSVVQNSSTVTGTNTTFAANARVGDAFLGPDGRWYEVANIASDTVLSLLPAYQGVTTGSGTYALAPMQGYVKESADQLRALVSKFGTLAATPSINAFAGLTGLAGRFAYFTAPDQMALAPLSDYARSGANSDITSLSGLTTALSVAQGGTGVNNLASLLAALNGIGNYFKGNILGTVSQAGGIPTGAIIESGINANGRYVKFADGTLICTSQGANIYTPNYAINSISNQFSINLPATYVDTAFSIYASVGPNISNDHYGVTNPVSAISQTGFAIIIRNGATSPQAFSVRYMTIGKWF